MNMIPAGIDPGDLMQSDVIDNLAEYSCPFCGAKMSYLRDDDVECGCGQIFWVEIVIGRNGHSFSFWQNGDTVKPKPSAEVSAAARAMGQMTSPRKASASRENGKRGGRPRKVVTE